MRKIKLAGVCTQLWGRQENIFGSLVRLNFSSQFLTPNGTNFGKVTLSPTWQNFPKYEPKNSMDTYLQKMHDRGIYTMVNVLNGFNLQTKLPPKSIPRNKPKLDPNDMAGYSIVTKICEQIVLRYGNVKNDALIDIAPLPTWAPQTKVSGLGTMSALQVLNEVNNNWTKPEEEATLTADTYARVCHHIWQAIQRIDPSMPMVVGPTYSWFPDYMELFLSTWEKEFGAFPKWSPYSNTGIMISFNMYLHDGKTGPWGNSNVLDPAVIFERFAPIQQWLEDKGLHAMVTEFGCNSEKRSDLGYPDYPGLDKYQSQAKFINDCTSNMLSFQNIAGATAYQLSDDANEHRFQYTGLMKDNDNKKPSYDIVKKYFEDNFPPVIFPVEEPVEKDYVDEIYTDAPDSVTFVFKSGKIIKK